MSKYLKSFFTVAEGYEFFSQTQTGNQLTTSIDLREGQFRLNEVTLAATEGKRPRSAEATFSGKTVAAKIDVKNGDVRLTFQSPLVLKSGEILKTQVELV